MPLDEKLENEVRELCSQGRVPDAADRAVRGYGPEILNLLAHTIGDPGEAADVFSQFQADLLQGLGKFQWRSSLRTWSYTLARNAWHRHRASPAGDPARRVPISQVEEAPDAEWSATAPWMKTQAKDRFREEVARLPPDERLLFALYGEGMEWNDIARITLGQGSGGEESPTPEAIKVESARLRKSFERLKKKIAPALVDR